MIAPSEKKMHNSLELVYSNGMLAKTMNIKQAMLSLIPCSI